MRARHVSILLICATILIFMSAQVVSADYIKITESSSDDVLYQTEGYDDAEKAALEELEQEEAEEVYCCDDPDDESSNNGNVDAEDAAEVDAEADAEAFIEDSIDSSASISTPDEIIETIEER